MADESEIPIPAAVKAKRKPGRPPKRHDPDPAPIDGDYQADQIVNKKPGFDYGLISDRLLGRYLAQGWQIERYGAGCARALWDYGEHKDGEPVKDGSTHQLTLVRIPTKRREAIQQRERQWHSSAKAALKQTAEDSGGRMRVFKGVHF